MSRAIVLSMLLAGCAYSQVGDSYYRVGVPGLLSFGPGPTRAAPELTPDRQIAEQDCSAPVDFTLGNLRCK